MNEFRRRRRSGVVARRASRTVATTLAVIGTFALAVLLIGINEPGIFDLPVVGPYLLIAMLGVLVVAAVVGLILWLVRRTNGLRVWALARRVRPGLRSWAARHGWGHLRKVRRDREPSPVWAPVDNMMARLRAHARELKIDGVSQDAATHAITDLLHGRFGPYEAFVPGRRGRPAVACPVGDRQVTR